MWPESSVNVARVGDLTWSNDRIRAGVRVMSWPGGGELNKMKTQGSEKKGRKAKGNPNYGAIISRGTRLVDTCCSPLV